MKLRLDALPRLHRSLGVRIVLFLSIALLPVGLIALYQTREVANQAARRTELALQALTERAARRERTVLQSALGALDQAQTTIDLYWNDPETCARVMGGFLADNPEFSFFGFIRPDLTMDCSSLGRPMAFDETAGNLEFWKDPKRKVSVNMTPPLSAEPVIIVTDPVWRGGKLEGALSLSVPHRVLHVPEDDDAKQQPLELFTFNRTGDILTSSVNFKDAQQMIPRDRALVNFVDEQSFSFTGHNRNGDPRAFAVVPILAGSVYALGAYELPSVTFGAGALRFPAWVFPILMWLVSLVVAYVAMDRLVIRNIRILQRQMREFSQSRRIPEGRSLSDKPRELVEIENSFLAMTKALVRDEAQLENAVHEKNVLLKEVHHRVKNNLQLISSIMNMKMRKTSNPETIDVIRRLQHRVMGLARIHRTLYQTQNLGAVDVGTLVSEIVDQMLILGGDLSQKVRVDREIEKIVLYPDQAVPLSLLVSEATTNALKNMGKPEDGEQWFKIRLYKDGPDHACVEISNSVYGPQKAPDEKSIGLGTQLIRAFASQLEGELSIYREDDLFCVAVRFPIAMFSPEPVDY